MIVYLLAYFLPIFIILSHLYMCGEILMDELILSLLPIVNICLSVIVIYGYIEWAFGKILSFKTPIYKRTK